MTIALWGQLVLDFDGDHYMQMATHDSVVFLFVGVTSGEFNGIKLY